MPLSRQPHILMILQVLCLVFGSPSLTLADITDVLSSNVHTDGIEVHMNALQGQLATMQEERTQVLSLLDNMGVFESGEEDVSRHDPLPTLLQLFVTRCTEAVQKGARDLQAQSQQTSEAVAEARALRERVAQLEAVAQKGESAAASAGTREAELAAALQAAQEKVQKDRALARTKIEQLIAERASLQQQLATAREAQEQCVLVFPSSARVFVVG
jgi:DNA repair exonuclease SbcCD ATPase subunit